MRSLYEEVRLGELRFARGDLQEGKTFQQASKSLSSESGRVTMGYQTFTERESEKSKLGNMSQRRTSLEKDIYILWLENQVDMQFKQQPREITKCGSQSDHSDIRGCCCCSVGEEDERWGSFKDHEQDCEGAEGGAALGDQPPTLEEEGFTLDFLVFLPWFTMKSA